MTDEDTPPCRPDQHALFRQSTVPTLLVDLNQQAILQVNKAACEALGLPEEEIVGRPGRDFLVDPSPDQVLRLRGLRQEQTTTISGIRTASGTRTAELCIVPSDVEGIVFVQAVDLTDILESNAALEERALQLQAQTSALESFAARVAHDLRSPLASIAGFVDLLARPDFDIDDAQRLHMLERIGANVKSLNTMIGELIDETRRVGAEAE